jgi:hypothetical protein
MRSWENRTDSLVVDEPLYAPFLQSTGIDHPGRDLVLATYSADLDEAVAGLFAPLPAGVRVFYQKHMAHHLTDDVPREWIGRLDNVMVIRDPGEVVASYVRSRSEVTALDIGLPQQVDLFDELARAGRTPLVVDAADFLRDPRRYLQALCRQFGLPWQEAMLSWPAGPRDTDGVWAPYWYDAVVASTGFEPYRPREVSLRGHAAAVADECRPLYERLHQHRWTP